MLCRINRLNLHCNEIVARCRVALSAFRNRVLYRLENPFL